MAAERPAPERPAGKESSMNVQTKFSALALPLALLLALAQGGSCAGGARAVQNSNADRKAVANKNANANVSVNVNKNTAGGASAEEDERKNANADAEASADTNRNANSGAASNANRERDEREDGPAVGEEGTAGVGGLTRGVWGGRGVQLEVEARGATVEFDCAHGRIESLTLDADGNFEARGRIVAERGGPVRVDEREEERPARFTGKVSGEKMTLTVTPEGGDPWEPTFTLTLGGGARLRKCL
jgi:hypothetical protein